MTFPTIPTVAAGRVLFTLNTTGGSPKTFPDLSPLTKNAGDLLVAICVEYQGTSTTNAEFSSWGGGFTEFKDQSTSSTTMAIGCAHKWSTGSEAGTFQVSTVNTSTNDSVLILMSIPGAHATTPPEAGDIVHGTTTAANPAVLDPTSWGAEDALWVFVGGCGETSTTGAFTGIGAAPTNYTDAAWSGITADVVGGVEAVVAFRQLNAASEDAGPSDPDLSNARNSALLIAVRPAAVQPTGTVAAAQDDQTSTATGVLGYTGTAAINVLPIDDVDSGSTSTPPTDIIDVGDTATAPVDVYDAGEGQGWQWSTATGWITITGTVAQTQENQTSTASGTVAGGGAVTGTVAVTQNDQTSTATGILGYTGTSTQTQADQTATASGWITVTGTSAQTQADQISTATGVLGYSGSSTQTQDDQTSTAFGTSAAPGISGTVAATQDDQTSTAVGVLGYTGTSAQTQDDQTSTASGTSFAPGTSGTVAATQDDQTATATGQLGYTGSSAQTQGDQTAAAAGWITITGTVAATQTDQTSTATGGLGYSGTAAIIQDGQAATATGWITVTGLAAVIQDNQTSTATGFIGEIPVPSGHPVTVGPGIRTVTVDDPSHAVMVLSGQHMVEVK